MALYFTQFKGAIEYKATQSKSSGNVTLFRRVKTNKDKRWEKITVLTAEKGLSNGRLLQLCRNYLAEGKGSP